MIHKKNTKERKETIKTGNAESRSTNSINLMINYDTQQRNTIKRV